MFVFDPESLKKIFSSFDSKELEQASAQAQASKDDEYVVGPGGRKRKVVKSLAKEEICTRPGCVHWQPPPPCVWDLPCKADCFEAHPGIQPGRNPLGRTGGGVQVASGQPKPAGARKSHSKKPYDLIKLLTAECCTGCSEGGSGGPVAGMPVMIMKY